MHPLFTAVLEILGCGLGQLSPNAVIQIAGVAARSHELKEIPTVDLLFSIFWFKISGGQLYLDKKPKRTRLVYVRPSNTGYQVKWTYCAGHELSSIKPWGDVSKVWLHALNHLPSLPEAYLKHFHGTKEKYDFEHFLNDDFLVKRCCKLSCLNFVPLSVKGHLR